MSEFSTNGFDAMPSIYPDSKLVGEFSTWSDEVLADRLRQYVQFLAKPDLMPRARQESQRIKEHLLFEMMYRDGLFEGAVMLEGSTAA